MLIQKTLAVGLAISPATDRYTVFRDHLTKLEYIRQNSELCNHGLYVELGPYEYHVFLDFREIEDDDHHHYARLNQYLNGRGVPSVDAALRDIFLQPIHHSFAQLSDEGILRRLWNARSAFLAGELESPPEGLLLDVVARTTDLLTDIKRHTKGAGDVKAQNEKVASIVECLMTGFDLKKEVSGEDKEVLWRNISDIQENLKKDDLVFYTLCNWAFVHALGSIASDNESDALEMSRSWIDEWFLGRFIIQALSDLGFDGETAFKTVTVIKLLTTYQNWYRDYEDTYGLISGLLHDNDVRDFLQINRHLDILWFNKEAFEGLLFWMILVAGVKTRCDRSVTEETTKGTVEKAISFMKPLYEALEGSQYRVDKLLELIRAYSSSQESE
jgi:hypothetical protein